MRVRFGSKTLPKAVTTSNFEETGENEERDDDDDATSGPLAAHDSCDFHVFAHADSPLISRVAVWCRPQGKNYS